MSGYSYLISSLLFVSQPQESDTPVESFYDEDYVRNSSYTDLIDLTYHLITRGANKLEKELLVLWEIRLTLLLFNGELPVAKREAINLNNALFQHENPNSPIPPISTNANPLPLLIDNNGSRGNTPRLSPAPNVIYPLPKNNAGLINYLLLMLVLRLKSMRNLALVNELYKLCYQVRLKGSSSKAMSVQLKLFNLSYEIVSVLITTRNYYTLLSLLRSLRRDTTLRVHKLNVPEPQYQTFASNISFLWIYANLVVYSTKVSEPELSTYADQFENEWSSIEDGTKKSLLHVMGTYAPLIGGPNPTSPSLREQDFHIRTFANMIATDKVSPRIICCTLGTWDLENKLDSNFDAGEGYFDSGTSSQSLSKIYAYILSKWSDHVHNVYGME